MKIISSRWPCTRPNTPAPSPNSTRTISASMRGTPWFDDGNVIILSGDGETAFKSYLGLLMHSSAWFEERVWELSDDSAEVVDDCALIKMDKDDSAQDLSHFLEAMHNGITSASLDTVKDLVSLTGTLRLATKYSARLLRTQTLAVLQARYPPTLPDFDRATETAASPSAWSPDPILIINLARETSAFALLPAAMAVLTNETSAGEVFGVRLHANTPARIPHHALNPTDALAFGLMKELHYTSIVLLLKFIRGVAAGCRQPPEMNTRCMRTAPIGYISRADSPSVCAKTLHGMADDLSKKLSDLENPIGYLDFVVCVRRVTLQRSQICRRCRCDFEMGMKEKRSVWWNTLPLVFGFSGWGDDRLNEDRLE